MQYTRNFSRLPLIALLAIGCQEKNQPDIKDAGAADLTASTDTRPTPGDQSTVDKTSEPDLRLWPDVRPVLDGPPSHDLHAAPDGSGWSPPGTWQVIKAGKFKMGSPTTEKCRSPRETQHTVTLTKKFELMATEVTQGQFLDVMGTSSTFHRSCGRDCPVENVSWHQAAAYANTLSKQAKAKPCYTCTSSLKGWSCKEAPAYTGKNVYSCPGYRLPTEAEWEYAYRAMTTTAFYNGGISVCGSKDANLDKIGWYRGNTTSGPQKVAQKQPNAWKLYDMAGNVVEWCHDWYASYPAGSVSDPVGTSGTSRVVRGGSIVEAPGVARAASRSGNPPYYFVHFLGFRVARSIP